MLERDSRIDIAKALGILMVVLGHAGIPNPTAFYRFHMALFFALSGWCFKDKHLDKTESLIKYTVGKIKSLYIPFVAFNGVLMLLRNVLIRLNIYTDNERFLEASMIGGGNGYGLTLPLSFSEMKPWLINILKFSGEIQLGGATWFLRVLFVLSIGWIVINFILKTVAGFNDKYRMIINMILSDFFLAVSFRWNQNGELFFLQIETAACAYIIYSFGYYIKKYYNGFNVFQDIVVGSIALIILLYYDNLCNQMGWQSNVNVFSNPFLFVLTSVSGFFVVMSIASLIGRIRLESIKKCIVYIGRHSMSILLWHFLAFKVVNLIQCVVYHEPLYRIASFPVFKSDQWWWVAYTVSGILLPLLIPLVMDAIKGRVRSEGR